ncbi:hypothetical protein GR160_14045 [Flavobacterium sp. Sd200]|uniref:RICIN domain-containing protein n=1 Tax=Flavobacterium sp. Sd200 TaxID=2692211 RepID=UPI00136D884F|nr:RICIN domain-containing protein [Flavobacterium sp. Sd200]MXN92346.1 hypothetical protein [Flavobacterium sp. Sd200]
MKKIKFLIAVLFLATVSVTAQTKGVKFNPSYKGYYLLKTQFRGDGEALESNGAESKTMNGAAFMSAQKGNPVGQQWQFVEDPVNKGWYRLQSKLHGSKKSLEGNEINGKAKNGAAFMDDTKNVTGQLWKIEDAGNGYYRLKTKFQGANFSLEGNQAQGGKGGNAYMEKQQNVSGQLWYLVEVNPEVVAQDASLTQGIKYGDIIYLQNGWNNYAGGFLDTRGYQKDFEKTGNHLCVSTALSENRDKGSGSWKVLSASGKAIGTNVLIGDDVYLVNQWNNGNGGYLDTRGYQKDFEKTGNHLCVSTATSQNRDSGSGTWKIIGKNNGTPLKDSSEVYLKNGWNKFNGGYLDTRGYQKDFEKTGNHLCVSTAISENRDKGSGTWKIKLKK